MHQSRDTEDANRNKLRKTREKGEDSVRTKKATANPSFPLFFKWNTQLHPRTNNDEEDVHVPGRAVKLARWWTQEG